MHMARVISDGVAILVGSYKRDAVTIQLGETWVLVFKTTTCNIRTYLKLHTLGDITHV